VTLARVPEPVEGEVARPPRRELTFLRGPVAGVVAGLVVAGAAIGGYALGHSGRHSTKDVAAERRAAEQRAFAAAKQDLIARGRRDGFRAGAASGAAAGTRAGTRAASGSRSRKRATTATPAPGAIVTCPKTPIRKKTFVSSVKGISCDAAASEQQQALKAGHPTSTPKGFTCQKLDAQHYRCIKGAAAYRWDISP
jgi:hypothetical protein